MVTNQKLKKFKPLIKCHNQQMSQTSSVSWVQSIYLNMYSPRLAEHGNCLRELTKQNVPFIWGPEHTVTFDAVKREIISAPYSNIYDCTKSFTLQTDANLKGLGAVLLQEDNPVYFASKSLPPHQKAYVAIELHSLAIAWSMWKFHHSIYGKKIKLETDQMPLENVLPMSLTQATTRLW